MYYSDDSQRNPLLPSINNFLFLYNYFKIASIFFLNKKKCIHTNIKIILSIQRQYNYSFNNKKVFQNLRLNHTKKKKIPTYIFSILINIIKDKYLRALPSTSNPIESGPISN